jgi:MOSC domain-containing protein YiiM
MSSSSENGSASSCSSSVLGVLQEVRTGQIKSVFGPGIASAIFKAPVTVPVKVTKLGLEGDHQAFEDHGGLDKALLQYCSKHYDAWREEIPEARS